MEDRWILHSRLTRSRQDGCVSFHPNFVRAIEAASRLWRQGREPSQIEGPDGERIPRAQVEAAIAALYKIETMCEERHRGDLNSLYHVIARHGHLPWGEFVEAAMLECSGIEEG